MKETEKKSIKAASPFLYFSAFIADLIIFSSIAVFGWSSPVLPKLTGTNETDINPFGKEITSAEASWIASVPCLGAIFGPAIAGVAADKIGRKTTLILAACPLALSFVVIAYAKTLPLFYLCRFIKGVSVGGVFTVLPTYLAEISEDHNRGIVGCTLAASASFGLLFTFVVGPFVSIRHFCLLCAVPLVVSVPVFLIWVPETPHFLASTSRNQQLEESLTKLRNKSSEEIQTEVSAVIKIVTEDLKSRGGFGDLFKHKNSRKGLIISLSVLVLQQFAGINAILSYMQTIFKEAGCGLSSEISTIIVGIIQMIATVSTSLLVDRLGRRILLLSSTAGCCLTLSSLGLFFYLKDQHFNVGNISWLPVSSLVAFIIIFNVGLGPLPWVIMAELFPSNVRSSAATLNTSACFGGGFVVTLIFPELVLFVGMATSFWMFAVVCLIGEIFIYFYLPETKGKSVLQIQKLLEE